MSILFISLDAILSYINVDTILCSGIPDSNKKLVIRMN